MTDVGSSRLLVANYYSMYSVHVARPIVLVVICYGPVGHCVFVPSRVFVRILEASQVSDLGICFGKSNI